MTNIYRLNKPDKMTELHKLCKIGRFCQSRADKIAQSQNAKLVRRKSNKKHCVQRTKSRTTHALCNFVTDSIDTISEFRVLRRKSNKKHCVTVSMRFGQNDTFQVILLRSINSVVVTPTRGRLDKPATSVVGGEYTHRQPVHATATGKRMLSVCPRRDYGDFLVSKGAGNES